MKKLKMLYIGDLACGNDIDRFLDAMNCNEVHLFR